MHVYFNPLETACKSVIGGVKTGERFQLNLFLLKTDVKMRTDEHSPSNVLALPKQTECISPENKAFLLLHKDGEQVEEYEMLMTPFGWSITLSVQEIGLYFYSFRVDGKGYVSCGYLENGYFSERDGNKFLLTVSSSEYCTPDWFKGGVMYQIFPDRFCRVGTMPDIKGRIARTDWGGLPSYKPNAYGKVLNNDFFGGNFKGIQSKLPYLHDLGITTIYFNPIFEAASNHRYDTSDYMHLDPVLGDENDFSELIATAKSYGIRIILDGVFNHTGDDSVYFNKYGHYDSVGAYQSENSPYASWYSFERFPNKYASWWGIDILPEVNENSEDYQRFIFEKGGVLKKWLGFGIGGYRLDVADELPDFFLKKLRKSVKETDPNAIIIGEVWEDASNKVAYSTRREYLHGYELDSVMNYPLKDALIGYIQSENATRLLHTVRTLINHYPKETVDCLMNILGTHDTARILTVLGGIYCANKDEMAQKSAYLSPSAKKKAVEKLKLAAVLQFTLPGVPCIYYGDENGQEGHIDPFCRQCFDWDNLYKDLIDFYRCLGAIRKQYRSIFKDGVFEPIQIEDGLMYFKRTNENGSVYVIVNNSSKSYRLNLHGNYTEQMKNIKVKNVFDVEPYSYAILTKNN